MIELFAIRAARALVELLLWSYAGQIILALLSGNSHQQNPIYRFFAALTRPTVWPVRAMFGDWITETMTRGVAIFLLLLLWLLLSIWRFQFCQESGQICT